MAQRIYLEHTDETHHGASVYHLLQGGAQIGRVRREHYPKTLGCVWAYSGRIPKGMHGMPAFWRSLRECKKWVAGAGGAFDLDDNDLATAWGAFMGEAMPLPSTCVVSSAGGLVHHGHDRKEAEAVARLMAQQFKARVRLVHLTSAGARVVAGFEGFGELDLSNPRALAPVRPLAPCLECEGSPDGCPDCDGGAIATVSGGAGEAPEPLIKWGQMDRTGNVAPVPGGWLYLDCDSSGVALVHVPDPEHVWEAARAACGMPPHLPDLDAVFDAARCLDDRALSNLRGRLADLANARATT